MLSLIVCSCSPKRLEALKRNVEATIGTPHEWVVVDNSGGNYSLFTAYNLGVAQSKGEGVCFLHEDLHFHQSNWGEHLQRHLSDPTCGFVGVAGGTLMPRVPATWSAFKVISHFLQGQPDRKKRVLKVKGHFNGDHYANVVALDGLFLAARKTLFEHVRFDDDTFQGYHGYDIDICLQAHVSGFRNRVVNDILIEHFSSGTPNRQWVENCLKNHHKWRSSLPLYTGERPEEGLLASYERRYLLSPFMKRMIRAGFNNSEIEATLVSSLSHIEACTAPTFRRRLRSLIRWKRLLKQPRSLIPKFRLV